MQRGRWLDGAAEPGLISQIIVIAVEERSMRKWIVLIVVLLMGAIQLISLGIIGEYLGRTFNEVKQRPLYLVKQWNPSTQDCTRMTRAAATEGGQREC